jgi:hypothetical protein
MQRDLYISRKRISRITERKFVSKILHNSNKNLVNNFRQSFLSAA